MVGTPQGIMMKVIMSNPNAVKRTQRLVQNPKAMLEKVVIIIQKSTDKTFRQGGRPKWPQSHRAATQHGKTLQDEGSLQKSVAVHPIVKVGRHELAYGTSEKKAPALHFGYPPISNPARPFMDIYDEDKKQIEEVFKTSIRKTWAFGKVEVAA